jgi:hypothetical protein
MISWPVTGTNAVCVVPGTVFAADCVTPPGEVAVTGAVALPVASRVGVSRLVGTVVVSRPVAVSAVPVIPVEGRSDVLVMRGNRVPIGVGVAPPCPQAVVNSTRIAAGAKNKCEIFFISLTPVQSFIRT